MIRKTVDNILGRNIKRIRYEKKLSQIELAKHLNISQPTLFRLENGTHHFNFFINNLAKTLGIQKAELFMAPELRFDALTHDEKQLILLLRDMPERARTKSLEDYCSQASMIIHYHKKSLNQDILQQD